VLENDASPQFPLARECVDCGETDPRLLEIDHPGDHADFPSDEIILRDWETTPTHLEDFEVVCTHCHLSRARLRGPVGEIFRCWRNSRG
jgi:hypothetical protein